MYLRAPINALTRSRTPIAPSRRTVSPDDKPTPTGRVAQRLLWCLALGCWSFSFIGCQPADQSQGVEFVLSSSSPTPGMTFELRFDDVMASPGEIGVATTNSPMVITPSIPGVFTWLSQRSGVFTPAEPLAMDTRYELTL